MKLVNIQASHLKKGIMVFLFFLLFPILVQARDVTFQWTAVPEPVTGYKLYYKVGPDSQPPYVGTGADQGESPILVGKVNSFVVTGLSTTETYHFVLTAYNRGGESEFSSPVTVGPDSSTAPVIINISVK